MNSRYLALTFVVMLVTIVIACAAPSPTPAGKAAPAASPSSQDQALVDAARNGGEKEVFWWTTASVDPKTTIEPFEAKYSFLKVRQEVVFPSQGSTRLIEEAKTGVKSVDVVTWSDPALVLLNSNSLLAEHTWPGTSGWKNQPNHNFWRGVGISASTPVLINTQVVAQEQWPQKMDDLKNARYKGQVIASTSRETVILETAAFWKKSDEPDWDRSTQFWTEVVRTLQPAVTQGFEAPMERFVAGEFGLFVNAPLSNTVVLLEKGAPLAVPPVESVWGYNESVGILKNGPSPNAAKLLANFLASDGTLGLVDSRGLIANSPEVAKTAKANRRLGELQVSVIDSKFLTPELIKRSGDIWHGLLGLR